MLRCVPDRPRIVIVRGHQANQWELAPWQQPPIANHFAVSYLHSARGWFDTTGVALEARRVRTLRGLLPRGAPGNLAVRIPGDRYLGLAAALRGADIVHAQELGYWYSMQAARLRRRLGYRLVLTVWETIPFLGAYRNVRTRAYRETTLSQTDLFLAATERARESLLLEGVPAGRIRVCPPGVSTERFDRHRRNPHAPPLIVSAGRLVWEKGHQDVLRAVALLRRGNLERSAAGRNDVRLCIVGTGPEEGRLRTYAKELGIADVVDFRGFIEYSEMPAVYADATCVVLASLATWAWEEQFGMVLAEAILSGAPIVASASGAIPEVAGSCARYFSPGDWPALARMLDAVITDGRGLDPATTAARERSAFYSAEQAARRLAAAYHELLAGGMR
jgi:glycosyltransferase involved in cell wall biosynthesis